MDIYSMGRTPREADRLYRRQVERAWQTMIERGATPDAQIRDVIRHSWSRCLQLGLEPVSQRPRGHGSQLALEALREANADLLEATQNTWGVLGDILSQSQSCLLVADANGTLLDVCGRSTLLDRGARDCIAPGYTWSEYSAGTNAVGTAIALNAPAEVHSAEHFLSVAKIWSCSAAPVHDTVDGSILGVVDITSFGDNHQSHCLALAVTAAHQIEQTLQSRELARAVQLLHWYQLHGQRWAQGAVVVLDRKGRVVTASERARALFADGQPGTLERGHPFITVSGEPTAADCTAVLPPRTRVVGIEAYAGRGCAWEGGLLILEPERETRRMAPRVTPAAAVSEDVFGALVGRHPLLVELKRRAARVARTLAPVLLVGESGSGKETLARAMHRASPVAQGPFVTVDCGALSRESACRDLFGDERDPAAGGCLAEAAHGTLFLAEIGELPPAAQVALLRVLQPTGDAPPPARVRIIAASNRELEADVAACRFRDDLYYRLRVPSLRVPALRERLDDLAPLIDALIARLDATHGLGRKRLSPALLDLFTRHAWPGNLRELQGVIDSLYVLGEGTELDLADLPDGFLSAGPALAPGTDELPAGSISHMTRAAIEAEMATHGDNLSEVARRLGISRSTLYRKIKRYGLELPGAPQT